MNSLDLFSNELTKKISCIPDYFIDESDLYNQLTKNYFQRINYKTNVETNILSSKTPPPKCDHFSQLDFSMSLFEHLEGMKKRHKLKMDPETSLGSKDLGISNVIIHCSQKIFIVFIFHRINWDIIDEFSANYVFTVKKQSKFLEVIYAYFLLLAI